MKKQTMGFILIITIIVSNMFLAFVGMKQGRPEIANNFSWGFTSAIVVMLGLMWMFDAEK